VFNVASVSAGRWFSPGTPASSINKSDHQDIAKILLKDKKKQKKKK
jgi:hypothetical protein